jgi:hypothetical protein
MVRKNSLKAKEAKGFGSSIKTKNQEKPKSQNTVAPDNQWEAWECRGESNNPAHWHQVWQGSFEDCFETIAEHVSCQLDEILNRDGSLDAVLHKYEHDHHLITQILEGMYQPRIKGIKTECLKNGGYKGSTWALALTSQSTSFRPQGAKDGIFIYSDDWQGWEQMGEDADDPDSWRLMGRAALVEECLEEMMFFVNMEVELNDKRKVTDDMDIEKYFQGKAKQRLQLIEQIKSTCLTNGRYTGRSWIISCGKTSEECWWIARHGSLDNYPR